MAFDKRSFRPWAGLYMPTVRSVQTEHRDQCMFSPVLDEKKAMYGFS